MTPASVRPNFFLVGAPRSGTTAMHRYLRQHPEIFMSPVKEPHFFGSDLRLRGQREDEFRGDEAAYLALFEGAEGYPVVAESSPGYLISECAAQEIHAFNPEARIMVMLRSPADVLVSLHKHSLWTGDEELPLEEALLAEPDRRAGRRIPASCQNVHALLYRENVQFHRHLRRYFDAFGRDRVHVELYDDFQADTAAVYRRTLEFLEVDPAFRPEFPVVNPSRSYRSRRLRALLASRRRRDRRRGRLGRAIAAPAGRLLVRLNTRQEPASDADAELHRRLRIELGPVVDDLGELIGRDLSAWKEA